MRVEDATGRAESAEATIDLVSVPCVVRYDVAHATSAHARDGEVTAVVDGAPADAQYLWTGGALTDEPRVRFCGPGTYAACLVRRASAAGRTPVPHLHIALPARVRVLHPDADRAAPGVAAGHGRAP